MKICVLCDYFIGFFCYSAIITPWTRFVSIVEKMLKKLSTLDTFFDNSTLFRNKRFMLDEMSQRNASKFAIFLEHENPCSFFRFSFRATLIFFPPNALVYVDIREEKIVARYEKRKKTTYSTWVFIFIPKIWQILRCFAGTFHQAQTSYF